MGNSFKFIVNSGSPCDVPGGSKLLMEDHEKQGVAVRAAKSLDRKFDELNICDIFDQYKAASQEIAHGRRINLRETFTTRENISANHRSPKSISVEFNAGGRCIRSRNYSAENIKGSLIRLPFA